MQHDRRLDVKADVPEHAEVGAQVEDVARLREHEILDQLVARHRVARGLQLGRFALDEGALRLRAASDGQVEVEAIVVVEAPRPRASPRRRRVRAASPTRAAASAPANHCPRDPSIGCRRCRSKECRDDNTTVRNLAPRVTPRSAGRGRWTFADGQRAASGPVSLFAQARTPSSSSAGSCGDLQLARRLGHVAAGLVERL